MCVKCFGHKQIRAGSRITAGWILQLCQCPLKWLSCVVTTVADGTGGCLFFFFFLPLSFQTPTSKVLMHA